MGQRHLGKAFHGDTLGGDVLDVFHIDQIGAVRAQKARVIASCRANSSMLPLLSMTVPSSRWNTSVRPCTSQYSRLSSVMRVTPLLQRRIRLCWVRLRHSAKTASVRRKKLSFQMGLSW